MLRTFSVILSQPSPPQHCQLSRCSTSQPENTVLSESQTTIHCTSTRSPTIHPLSLDKFQLPLAQDYHHPLLTPRNLINPHNYTMTPLDPVVTMKESSMRKTGIPERKRIESDHKTLFG